MLVLSRKAGESLVIGDEMAIKVLSVNGNKVRLGIEAPDWIKVVRSELLAPLDAPSAAYQAPPSPPRPCQR